MVGAIDQSRPTFVSYIERTRAHYLAQGYGNPYRYAFHREAPFARLMKPLAEMRLGVVTTATLLDPVSGETPRPKRVYAASMDTPSERVFTADLAWAKESTHMDDRECYLPIGRLGEWVAAGRVGELASRFYGLPTEHMQRNTREVDAPAVSGAVPGGRGGGGATGADLTDLSSVRGADGAASGVERDCDGDPGQCAGCD